MIIELSVVGIPYYYYPSEKSELSIRVMQLQSYADYAKLLFDHSILYYSFQIISEKVLMSFETSDLDQVSHF